MTKFKFFTQALDLEDSLSETINIKKKLLVYWLSYTSLFAVIFFIGFSAVWANNMSFLWRGDGHNQHLPVLKFYSEYWRAFFGNIFSGNFQLPMFDFRLGLGDDIIQSLAANSIGSIFHILSVFVPPNHIDVYYDIIFVLRIYLAGISFSILCIYARQKYWAILIGSLCYVFSGFVLKGIFHPMFPMVYTPLLFLGLDLILQKKKPFLFIICVFLLATTSFYYLYMITVFLIVYALLRVHHLHGKLFWKNLLPSALRASLHYIIGLLMSAVLMLPTILGYLGSTRTGRSDYLGSDGTEVINILLFSNTVIIDRILFFLSVNGLYLAGIVTLALAALFISKVNKNDKRHLITFFIFSWLLFLLPFGGLLLNGFAYMTDRWIFLFNFVLCFITVYMLPQKYFEGDRKKIAISILIASIIIYAVNLGLSLDFFPVNFFILVCTAALTVVFSIVNLNQLVKKLIIIAMAAINLTANTYFIYTTLEFYNQLAPKHAGIKWHLEAPDVPESVKMTDKSFYRMETPKPVFFHDVYNLAHLANAPLFLGYYGNSVYFSILNKNVIKGLKELENSNLYENIYYGFDGRTVLNTLSSNKYYALKYEEQEEEDGSGSYMQLSGNNIEHPYGYTFYDIDESRFQLTFKNECFLPLGYTYEKAVSYNEYEELNATDKQEAMLQAVVLNTEYANTRINQLSFSTNEIPYIYKAEGCVWENGILYKTNKDSSLTLYFDGKDNSETYIQLSGLKNYKYFLYNIGIYIKEYTFKGNKSELIPDQERFLFNLGYNEEGLNTATVTFPDEGCELKDIRVYCYPMDNYSRQVNALKEETLENINISANHVSGEITLKKSKFLVMTIPYSKGWSAKVNGIETELLQANTMFMALPLPAGKHTIELSYCTPGIKIGGLLSVIGFACFFFLVFKKRLTKKEPKN